MVSLRIQGFFVSRNISSNRRRPFCCLYIWHVFLMLLSMHVEVRVGFLIIASRCSFFFHTLRLGYIHELGYFSIVRTSIYRRLKFWLNVHLDETNSVSIITNLNLHQVIGQKFALRVVRGRSYASISGTWPRMIMLGCVELLSRKVSITKHQWPAPTSRICGVNIERLWLGWQWFCLIEDQ